MREGLKRNPQSMKTTKLLWIAVISVIVLAAGYLMVYRGRQAPTTVAANTARQNDSQNQKQAGPMALSGKEQTYIVASDYVSVRRNQTCVCRKRPSPTKNYKERIPQAWPLASIMEKAFWARLIPPIRTS